MLLVINPILSLVNNREQMQLNRDVLEMTHGNRLNMVSVNKTEDIESKMLNLEFPRKRVKICALVFGTNIYQSISHTIQRLC